MGRDLTLDPDTEAALKLALAKYHADYIRGVWAEKSPSGSDEIVIPASLNELDRELLKDLGIIARSAEPKSDTAAKSTTKSPSYSMERAKKYMDMAYRARSMATEKATYNSFAKAAIEQKAKMMYGKRAR